MEFRAEKEKGPPKKKTQRAATEKKVDCGTKLVN
jgi:hypothetical protein